MARPGDAVAVGDEEAAYACRERSAYGERVAVSGEGDAPVPAQGAELGEQRDAGAVGQGDLDDEQVERGDGAGTGSRLGDAGRLDDLEGAQRVEAADDDVTKAPVGDDGQGREPRGPYGVRRTPALDECAHGCLSGSCPRRSAPGGA